MWKCPNCGNENVNNFCSKCGYIKPEEVNRQNTYNEHWHKEHLKNYSKENTLKKTIIIATVFVFLVICVIIAFFAVKYFDEKSSEDISYSVNSQYVETSLPTVEAENFDERTQTRLYENHNEFIDTVKRNLGVTSKETITYNVDEPKYQDSVDMETVFVTFYENGQVVAKAECSTEDGSLICSVMNYEPKNEEPIRVAEGNVPQKTDTGYNVYTNSRFGYSIPYPDFFVPQEEAGNGSGRIFRGPDDQTSISCGGSHTPNVFEEASTLDGLYNFYRQNLDYTPTYERKGDSFFIFSGYMGDCIVYEKYILKSDGTDNLFRFIYPAHLKEEYDDIVTYISNNFKTGIGADSSVIN